MRQKSGPRVRTATRGKRPGYFLTTRCVRHREECWQRSGTLRNASANEIASTEDKPVGEVSPPDIALEIGDADSYSRSAIRSLSLP